MNETNIKETPVNSPIQPIFKDNFFNSYSMV